MHAHIAFVHTAPSRCCPFASQDPTRARKQGKMLTADFSEKSRWVLDRAGMKWVYHATVPHACVGSGDPPHPTVELQSSSWIAQNTQAAFANAVVALAARPGGLPIARVHAHAYTDAAPRIPFPGSVGTGTGGCPAGADMIADGGCVLRPRFDVERSYISRGGEAHRAEVPRRLLSRLQFVVPCLHLQHPPLCCATLSKRHHCATLWPSRPLCDVANCSSQPW